MCWLHQHFGDVLPAVRSGNRRRKRCGELWDDHGEREHPNSHRDDYGACAGPYRPRRGPGAWGDYPSSDERRDGYPGSSRNTATAAAKIATGIPTDTPAIANAAAAAGSGSHSLPFAI